MNRKEKRLFIKKAQDAGFDKKMAEMYLAIRENDVSELKEGDKVKLDVKKITESKDYQKLNPKYQEFVESNIDTIFTAHLEQRGLISLIEQPEWLFWGGNLIKVEPTH